MSYILDALKKSEQERKQGEIPGLESLQGQPQAPRFTDLILRYMLFGTLLIIALAIGIWMFSHQKPAQPVLEQTKEAITETTPTPQIDQSQKLNVDPVPPVKETENDKQKQPAIQAKPAEQLLPSPKALNTVTETEITAIEQPQKNESNLGDDELLPDNEEDSSATAKPKLTSFANLPANVRNALPELTIAAHYYANKTSSRMASINGRIMRQGQAVTDGLIVEEIIREGVIFSFHKYRFKLEVFNR